MPQHTCMEKYRRRRIDQLQRTITTYIQWNLSIKDTRIQWNFSIKDTLNKGHLSNEDTVCIPNHIELCTNLTPY